MSIFWRFKTSCTKLMTLHSIAEGFCIARFFEKDSWKFAQYGYNRLFTMIFSATNEFFSSFDYFFDISPMNYSLSWLFYNRKILSIFLENEKFLGKNPETLTWNHTTAFRIIVFFSAREFSVLGFWKPISPIFHLFLVVKL